IPIENSNFSVQTDMVIVAAGEEVRPDFHGTLEKDQKIFSGEVVGTVAAAIKSGGEATKQILFYLREGKRMPPEEKEQPKVIGLKDINLSYFKPQACQSKIASRKSAINEAQRCFSCGWCLAVIDEQSCLDCKLCFTRCPEHAVTMVERDTPLKVGTAMAGVSEEAVARICEAAHMYPDQVICYCHRVQAREIAAAILQGANTPEDISRATGARTGCGSLCITGIIRLLRAAGIKLTKAPGYQWYGITASIWDISPKLQQKYPEYYLAEDLQAINTVFPGGSKS
ncbi:MAG TPA: (2Fe-2S)-binding protein, partial [Dehalococcoidales bacterium]|nr:(2Fe-2S)-binding protein [Dehalococcoidales bacterium]